MPLLHTLLASLLVALSCAAEPDGDGVVGRYFSGVFGGYFGNEVIFNPQAVEEDKQEPRNRPCPDVDVIAPCVCTFNDQDTYFLDLDCSKVESEEQLTTIMSSTFPFPNFRKLTIESNYNLAVLRRDALGSATFQEFYITDGVLTEVETGALSSSSSTAISMHFENNDIAVFPWGELSSFTALVDLDVSSNSISTFPALISHSLKYLDLSNNSLGLVPDTAFKGASVIEEIYLNDVNMLEIVPGTFSGLHQLSTVSLNNNQLTEVPEGSIQFTVTSRYTDVFLSENKISTIAVNAISGVTHGSDIYLESNQLTDLFEDVWSPLLAKGARLHAQENPLDCGCGIAWIMLNSSILALIDDSTTCSDGELLVNLSPEIFEELC
ncbi:oplophorus-luciferin 2-monooxygenase non-catalytic subunit [Procambarus clarkii]|uniref:oplophorus-luciferin 2-monooxygenase non-catalytic subunit n=1 Tax=Procambarus clarkii TaxID=6728 RepID=UPI001E6787D4|nr:oplophorus-luciferin 2-monooxygenase non-catalytic subunit-like [Procambarus clarkii]